MPAITHVAVTVTDLAASEAWYTKVLGVKPVLDEDTGPFRHIVYPLGNTVLGLHGFPDLASTEPFNERKPGLDHIAFSVASRDELAEWATRLDELAWLTATSWTPATAPACRSATLTTSRLSCSLRPRDPPTASCRGLSDGWPTIQSLFVPNYRRCSVQAAIPADGGCGR
jgi:glyoxylase I family protein